MTLSDWLVVLSLAFGLYGFGRWLWGTYGPEERPAAAAPAGEGVKSSHNRPAFKPRSRRSNVQNATNAGSRRSDAAEPSVNVQGVQDSSTSPAAPIAGDVAPAGAAAVNEGGFTLSPRELVQLAEALSLRAEGATVEQAVCRAYGVTKGGSEGYRRAKAIFDAATALPGAAPAGTYQAPAAPARRRSTGRAAQR